MSIISDFSHLDTNTPFCRAEEPHGVETANQSVMAISGSGTICGLEGVVCDTATHSLISVPQLCKDKKAVVIFDSCGAVVYRRDAHVDSAINDIKEFSFQHNKPLLTAHLNDESLYELDVPLTPVVCKHTNMEISTTTAVTSDSDLWTPSGTKSL